MIPIITISLVVSSQYFSNNVGTGTLHITYQLLKVNIIFSAAVGFFFNNCQA